MLIEHNITEYLSLNNRNMQFYPSSRHVLVNIYNEERRKQLIWFLKHKLY